MKRILTTVVLIGLLSISAFAGQIPTVETAPAPSPPSVGAMVVLTVLSLIGR